MVHHAEEVSPPRARNNVPLEPNDVRLRPPGRKGAEEICRGDGRGPPQARRNADGALTRGENYFPVLLAHRSECVVPALNAERGEGDAK